MDNPRIVRLGLLGWFAGHLDEVFVERVFPSIVAVVPPRTLAEVADHTLVTDDVGDAQDANILRQLGKQGADVLQPFGGVIHVCPENPVPSAKLGRCVASGGEVIDVRPVHHWGFAVIDGPVCGMPHVPVFTDLAPASLRNLNRSVWLLIPDRPNHHDLIEVRLEYVQKPLNVLLTISGNNR